MIVSAMLAAIVLAQVQIGPDEVSVRSSPYWPLGASAVIRTQVDLVEVPVVVRDGKGHAIADLKRENFEILDSGKKREISSFTVENFSQVNYGGAKANAKQEESAQPETRRFIALILDDLNTDFATLRRAKTAAEKFVGESLGPGDRMAIFTTALTQNISFTGDVAKLKKAIEDIEPHSRFADQPLACPHIRPYEAYLLVNRLDDDLQTAKVTELQACQPGVNDAVSVIMQMSQGIWASAKGNSENTLRSIGSAVATLREMPGRRMVLLTSGGFLSNEMEQQLQQLMTAALHSGVIVNSMDLKGVYTVIAGGDASEEKGPAAVRWQTNRGQAKAQETRLQGRMEDAKDDALAVIANGTGGQFVANQNDLTAGYRKLSAMPEVIYVLGFNSGEVAHDGKFHPLKVRLVSGAKGSVQTRMGYSAPAKTPAADVAPESARDRLVMGADTPAEIAARVTATARPGECLVKAEIDLRKMNFDAKDSRRKQKLNVVVALIDAEGNFAAGREGEATLALKDATYEELASSEFSLSLAVPVAPGSYRLRVLVEEGLTGKKTAVSQAVEVHE
jgi:VWFA-related protein